MDDTNMSAVTGTSLRQPGVLKKNSWILPSFKLWRSETYRSCVPLGTVFSVVVDEKLLPVCTNADRSELLPESWLNVADVPWLTFIS